MRSLVRRDVRVFVGGSIAALVVWGVFIADRLGAFHGRTPLAVLAGLGAAVAVVSLAVWLSGPKELRRERHLVLAPLFLVAPVSLISLHYLGSSFIVVFLSSAVGFGAAIGAGLAWSGRRVDGRSPPE